jgi:hypothetical protein
MKGLLSIIFVSLLAISSISMVGCCCHNAKHHGHHHEHGAGKMHQEHGDK